MFRERRSTCADLCKRFTVEMEMRNAATGRSKTDLPALYDELEAKIRALESLGWTQDKYGEFLSPLVESCLPEDILLAFERSKNFKEDTPGEGRSLKLLMNFLKQEVKNDERWLSSLGIIFQLLSIKRKKEVNKLDKFPSAATLVTTHDRNGTGLLFMDGCIKLQSGLFLLKTRLGYVLTGKQGVLEKCNEGRDTVLNVIFLLVKELPVNELWNLESIGIFDPIQKLNEKSEHLKVIEGI
ncbi:uncharacterized protein TNCV_573391 [Trichonephila clavipes]|nr:uncharacterized protein TNCV_573391 [Trichonephila clavipes]